VVKSVRQQVSGDALAFALLGLLIVAGVVLRVLLSEAQSPGFLSSTDSIYYLIAAHTNVFMWAAEHNGNPWPAGYPTFLAAVYRLGDTASFVILVQHVLGVATAILWFFSVRRVASALWGLLPAAVILLAGPVLFMEHAPLSEALFAFLIAAAIFCAVQAYDRQPLVWGLAAGALAAMSATVRVIGLALVGVVLLWLLLGVSGPWRRRALAAAAGLAAVAVILGGYLVTMKSESGFGGPMLTRSDRPAATPARGRFVKRAANDLTRFWASSDKRAAGGFNYDGVVWLISNDVTLSNNVQYPDLTGDVAANSPSEWYPTVGTRTNAGPRTFMLGWERRTRLEGPVALLFLILSAGIWLARGRRLAGGLLFAGAMLAVMVLPVVYLVYDARYVIPGYGAFAATAAVGAACLWERVRGRSRARAGADRATDERDVGGGPPPRLHEGVAG
jgi:4-amino-4-deoxy-L-arabinose transferase-like glycosyltransferase